MLDCVAHGLRPTCGRGYLRNLVESTARPTADKAAKGLRKPSKKRAPDLANSFVLTACGRCSCLGVFFEKSVWREPWANRGPSYAGVKSRMLAVAFVDHEAFCREFHENLAKGGIFVPCEQAVELRSRVEVGIDLQFCRKHIVLEGEVVHCIPAELASAGAVPGVAVQFDWPVKKLCVAFSDLVGEIPAPSAGTPDEEDKVVDERRASPRAAARVLAQVRNVDGERIDGMTRNLSTSGIQLSLSGDPPPVGQPVIVVLTNSKNSESLEIPAEVARHVTSVAEDVVAIGIRFRLDADCREETKIFLNRLRNHEHTRRLGGINGDVEELGLAGLLQSFATSSQEGTITVMHGRREGYIAFSCGSLIAARTGRVTGSKALARMLRWKGGKFEFHAHIDANIERDTPVRLEGAVLEAMCAIDESRSAEASRLSRGTGLEISQVQLGLLGGDLSKLEGAVVDLVQSGANVGKVLDVIPESDNRVYDAIGSLLDLGILVPSTSGR